MENGRLEELSLYEDDDIHIDNIYLGRVKNIVKNIDAAFIEIKPGLQCYFDLKGLKYLHIVNRPDNKSLHQGDEVIVRISKAAVKSKDPVCTGRLGLSKDELKEVLKTAENRKAFSILRSGKPEFLSFIAGIAKKSELITTDDPILFEEIDAYLCDRMTDKRNILKLYTDEYPLNKLYKIDSIMEGLKQKTVWLKCGANIVIEHTEAMTVIDVNSAKSIDNKQDGHIALINKEAADEALRQIRLRNLSGMILIDFINDNEAESAKLCDYVKNLSEAESNNCRFIDITGLGIIELTRKKTGRPIYELL